jgi:toxin ParE1/3/4
MTVRVVVLPEAEEDARGAARWYEDQRGGLGLEFLGAFQDATDRAAERPESHPRWSEEPRYRRTRLSRFPYLLFYELRGDLLEIAALVHERRKPGFWLCRSGEQ